MRYGAVFELQMDAMTSTAGTGTGVDYDELYGFVKGSWGELRFGQEDSAASLLQIRRPGTLWMGDSDAWDEFLANSGYIIAGVGDGNDASKIIYLSPQFMGFDAGISYAANRFEGEQSTIPTSTSNFQRDYTGLTNEISAALRYRGTFGPVGVGASFVAQFADAGSLSANGAPIAAKDQNITTYAAGLLLRAYGFAVGGDYTWGNYRTTPANGSVAQGVDGSSQWAAGITYTIGALTLGGMYSQGTQDNGGTVADRTQTYMGLGAAYVLAPGMTLFANYNQISDENIPTAAPTKTGATLVSFGAGDNTRDITVLVAGVRIAF
jgi:predicted porin